MNSHNTIIVMLAVTAAILAGLLIGNFTSDPAYAGTASAKGGDYIMVPMQFTDSADLIIVIDQYAKRMNTYNYSKNSNAIELVDDKVDLANSIK